MPSDPAQRIPAERPLETAADAHGKTAAGPARVDSQRLFCGALELQIDHHGAIYRLRQTALGKLILTK